MNQTAFMALVVVTLCGSCLCQLNSPFEPGYSMGTLGTVLWEDGPAGHEPWTPAAFLNDSLRFGFELAGIRYYDRMDNTGSSWLALACAGGWYRSPMLTVKAAYRQFDAFHLYAEQHGSISVGRPIGNVLAASVELDGTRAAIRSFGGEARTVVQGGITVRVPRPYASVTLQIAGLTLKQSGVSGLENVPRAALGIHTRRHRAGGLGTVAEVRFEDRPRLRFRHGFEYRLGKSVALDLAVQTSPFLLAFGLTLDFAHYGTTVALVNHPVLGWSKGFGAQFTR